MAKAERVQEVITRLESCINDDLKEDLRSLESRLQKVNEEMADLIQQKHALKVITDKEIHPTGFKTQVNLGSNFFMEAAVADTSKLLMNIGLNYYVELTLLEANEFLNDRIFTYEKISNIVKHKVAQTKAHIKILLFGLDELHKKENKT